MAVTTYSLQQERFDELKRRALQAALDNNVSGRVESTVLVKEAQVVFEWLLSTGQE